MKKVAIFVILVVTFAIAQVTMGQIAITEFLNDPLGSDTDMGSEYIELYNFSENDVDIQNWMLKDEDHDLLGGEDYFIITDVSFIIPPGGYAVLAANKDTLAFHWFGGVTDVRVIEYGGPSTTTMQLSNSGDELILLNAVGDTIWNFAWMNDDEYDSGTGADDGYSTYLGYGTNFSTTVTSWGNKAAPGIVRNGNDIVAGSPLGYEGGAFTADASAWVSVAGNSGSPLTGNYQEKLALRSEYKIAITEFINDPLGSDTDMGSEYIELFNYGTTNVDIQGWTMKDEDHDSLGGPDYFTIIDSSFIIPPGGYAVLTASKDTLSAHWLNGESDARVIEYGGPNSTTMQLSNSGDELILLDAAGDSVWNFAWSNDDAYDGTTDDGYSTYLDYGTDFLTTVTIWGNKAAPGIVRNGNDNVVSAPLGYEGGAFTADVSAWMSTAGNSGSPLTGNYLPIATNIDDENRLLPTGYLLKQNYPNPFNPVTNIHYQLPEQAFVSLIIYDLLGKKVATLVNEQQAAGSYSIPWHAMTDTKTMLSTGVYLCRINAQGSNNGFSKVVKMLYLK